MAKKIIVLALAAIMIVTIIVSSQAACLHNFQWITTKAAVSCIEPGVQQYKCAYCPAVASTRTISGAHEYIAVTQGLKLCRLCGKRSGNPLIH